VRGIRRTSHIEILRAQVGAAIALVRTAAIDESGWPLNELGAGAAPTDTRERYPFRFVQQNVETIRHAGVEKINAEDLVTGPLSADHRCGCGR
jgi:hypothetical protein